MDVLIVDEQQTWQPFLDWLRQAIDTRGMTLRQLGTYSGVSTAAISSILRGQGRPEMGTVYRLARYFKADPLYVLKLAGYEIEQAERPELIPELDLAMWDIGRELTPDEQRRLARFIRAYLPEPPKPEP